MQYVKLQIKPSQLGLNVDGKLIAEFS